MIDHLMLERMRLGRVDLPEPPHPSIPVSGSVLTVGIGGTGVVTVNQMLATAARLDGKQVTSLDQIGLAQKGGPVVSHLQIGDELPETASRISEGSADAYLVFDVVAGVAAPNLARAAADRTTAVVSTSRVPTGEMVSDIEREAFPSVARFRRHIDAVRGATKVGFEVGLAVDVR